MGLNVFVLFFNFITSVSGNQSKGEASESSAMPTCEQWKELVYLPALCGDCTLSDSPCDAWTGEQGKV